MNKVQKEITQNQLKEWTFEKLSRNDNKDKEELNIQGNTPICKDCANYVHSEMLKKYMKSKSEEEIGEKKENEGGVVIRLYNKVKHMKFM